MGVKGRRGETRFHGFKLFLSRRCFPPLQQLISLVLGLRPGPASSPRFPAPQQALSHLGKSFAERTRQGSEQSALSHVTPWLLWSFQVALPYRCFLLLLKQPLTQMRPSCTSASTAPNHGGCHGLGIHHSPPLSCCFPQGRRLFAAPLFPLASLKGHPSNPIFSRGAAHGSNCFRDCIEIGPAGGIWGVPQQELTMPRAMPSIPASPRQSLLALSSQALLALCPPRSLSEQILPTDQGQTSPQETL